MTASSIISGLRLPDDARVDQRVPKKLLVENGAPTAADRRQINDGVEDLRWLASLKPATIGVPVFRDNTREYLEIAVLSLVLRAGAKAGRLTELIHRAIPYPVFLVQSQANSLVLSLAHLRWSHGHSDQTVLDGPLVMATVDADFSATAAFITSLDVSSQPRQNIFVFYQGWVERFEAYAAARLTGRFVLTQDDAFSMRRRTALAEHERITREISSLRVRAFKETQINHRVELNLQLKQLESLLAEITTTL
ncbi:MAG: DUF4391 domain-containing protein [Ignavibacteria bacterium]|nr:DUF4391 domain-containing protein [Ignavibacteria bacterium]